MLPLILSAQTQLFKHLLNRACLFRLEINSFFISACRSTQGVTLEDLKSAEQLVKRKQQQVRGIHQCYNAAACKVLLNQPQRKLSKQ